MQTIPIWYLPSFYGDIRLTSVPTLGPLTMVETEALTDQERQALMALAVKATKKEWKIHSPKEGGAITDLGSFLQAGGRKRTFWVDAPIGKIAPILSKAMKPGRKLLSVVKFASGKMEEVHESGATLETAHERHPTSEPIAATTVAAPVRGCPAPDFPAAELRANEVLSQFLSNDQLEDFRRYNRFISMGATTGTRYMITSRRAKDELASYHRSLYDLDARTPLCVHDWSVPAAEEMLSLHLLLQLPGWENYLRHTEDNLEPYLASSTSGGHRLTT